jgi:hypothetical protein
MADRQEELKQEIARLLAYQRAHRPRKVLDQTREQMSVGLGKLSKKELDRGFANVKKAGPKVSADTATYVRTFCYDTLAAVNALADERRFLILQTINFFGDESLLAKFIQLLLLEGTATRKALASLFLNTFRSTHQVIKSLTAQNRIFSARGGDADKGELYVFQSDLARKLLRLFPQGFIAEQGKRYNVEDTHPIELLIRIIERNAPQELQQAMVAEDEGITMTLVDYMALLQTHHALSIYAVKRYDYLKFFLVHELRREGKLKGLEPSHVTMLVAGALVSNAQLTPPDELIYDLMRENRFMLPETVAAEEAFLDKLAPNTLDAAVRQVYSMLKKLSLPEPDLEQVFAEVRQLAEEEGLLAKLESGFLGLVEQGMIAASDLVRDVREAIRARRRRREEAAPKIDPGVYRQPKRKESLEALRKYEMVATDKIGFRGGEGKTIIKDFAETLNVFKSDEQVVFYFKKCFFTLFRFFEQHPELEKVCKIEQPHPRGEEAEFYEWYVAFKIPNLDDKVMLREPHLLCLGLTYFPRREAIVTEEPESAFDAYEGDLDPYVILFVGVPTPTGAGRAASRKIDGKGRTYNQVPLLDVHLPIVHEALHDILHLLPDEEQAYWNADEVQVCLAFLRRSVGAARR